MQGAVQEERSRCSYCLRKHSPPEPTNPSDKQRRPDQRQTLQKILQKKNEIGSIPNVLDTIFQKQWFERLVESYIIISPEKASPSIVLRGQYLEAYNI